MKICAATGNAGKLRELRRILEAQGHEVVSQKELGITIEPEETGTTFAENALIKAETICKASGLPTIADDSGLCVDALDGAPGVYSARYCGHHGDDEANNDKLLAAMQAVPAGQRGAKFVSAVCFILPDGRHLTCMGECPGSIAFTRLCGDYGFGYDPLFIPADCGWKQAQTTGGGLSLTEVTPSFQFKGCPGLYFVGETLDCAGSCGGFNLHWAFGSGITAGRDAVRSLKRPAPKPNKKKR